MPLYCGRSYVMQKAVLSREEKGRLIAENPSQIQRMDERHYKVASQSRDGMYDVIHRENGSWLCNCLDFHYRALEQAPNSSVQAHHSLSDTRAVTRKGKRKRNHSTCRNHCLHLLSLRQEPEKVRNPTQQVRRHSTISM